MREKEIDFVFDESTIKSMTADFIKNYKSRLTNKSLNELDYVDDIVEAYTRGIHNGCMLVLNMLKETTAEVNANE